MKRKNEREVGDKFSEESAPWSTPSGTNGRQVRGGSVESYSCSVAQRRRCKNIRSTGHRRVERAPFISTRRQSTQVYSPPIWAVLSHLYMREN